MTMRAGDLSRDPRLTKEQEATRRRGLRILARMIVRAHLASLIEDDARSNGSGSEDDMSRTLSTKGRNPRKEDERVR